MRFQPGNDLWKRRKANRGGRPNKQAVERKRLEQEALNREIKEWANEYTAVIFERLLGKRIVRAILDRAIRI